MASATGQDRVRELQRALYRAAKADPKRRFQALYDKVYRRDVLERASGEVRANRGAAGIDRITIGQVGQCGVDRLLERLTAGVRVGSYRPLPARRVLIFEARLGRAASALDSCCLRPGRAGGDEDRD